MNKRLAEIRERLAELKGQLEEFRQMEAPTKEDTERGSKDLAEWDTLLAEAKPLEERQARLDAVREHAIPQGRTERGTFEAPQVLIRQDPFAVLEDRSLYGRDLQRALVDSNLRAIDGNVEGTGPQVHFEKVLKRHKSDTVWAANLLARQTEDYQAAWVKIMAGRPELLSQEERTALSSGSNTNGGYLIPTHLDPTIILTNSGTSNVIRSISRVVTLTEGTTWNGVTSAGVTASWDGELTEVSDDTPTFARTSVSTIVAQSFVQGSIAASEDISGLASDILMLFADAKDRLEGAAHATGTGSGQPKGIVTALDASTSVEITSTTAATIGEVDIHSLYRNVPIRWRGNGTWLANPLYTLAVKRLGTAVSSSYSGDLTMPVSERWLGRPLVESDDMPTTQTTTALDNEIIFGDFSNYLIVDKPGSMSVEYIPHLFATANNLPDGRRGWFAYWRTGADSTNISAFRILQDKTSA